MEIDNLLVIISLSIVIFGFAAIYFKKALYTWILLAGSIGVPVVVVRESHLMLSELMLAPLLLLWFLDRKLTLGFIKPLRIPRIGTNLERSMWSMIIAFIISSIFNIVFINPLLGGEHVFVLGKIMALFLYVSSVMTALLIADLIHSFGDIRKICFLLIAIGTVSFIVQFQTDTSYLGFLRVIQKDVKWAWLNIGVLFAFSLAHVAFHHKFSKKLFYFFCCLFLAVPIFYSFLMGTATYKAIILLYFIMVFTIFLYRSKLMALSFGYISIVVLLITFTILAYYVEQEINEGSWGWKASARPAIWMHSLLIFKERPIFGVGPYNYYDYSLYIDARRIENDRSWGVMTSPHSQYLQILVETGSIGFIAFLWFMFEICRLLKFFLKHNSDYRINIIASALSAIIVSRLAVGILGDYIIPQYHNAGLQSFCSTVYFWVCLGVLIGLKKPISGEVKHMEESKPLSQLV